MSEVYKVSSSEKIQFLENELASQLAELKTEIEENGVLHGTPGRAYSSVPRPKDILYFRRERELVLKRTLQVAGSRPIVIQAETMERELESCLRREYTAENLPLLLHQFYTDRIHQLLRSKYMHLLRWKRFCQHTSIMEQCYSYYKKQVHFIMLEYNDSLQRAQRLSVAREHMITGQKNSLYLVTMEDLVIYLQWLICHLHSVKHIHRYIQTLQYLPISEHAEAVIEAHRKDLESRPKDLARFGSVNSSPQFSTELKGHSEDTLLPQHQTETETLKPLLQQLLSSFKIDHEVEKLKNTANEMELLSVVVTKFRNIFSKQQTMRTFPVYDSGLESVDKWGFRGPNMALKKTANWIPFAKVKPRPDPWQQNYLRKLKQHKKVDELLRLQSQFLEISNAEKVMETLQEHAARVLEPLPVHGVTATSSYEMWVRIYCPPDLSQDISESLSPWQTSEKSPDTANSSKRPISSRQKKETGYNYQSALQILGLEEADDNRNDPVMMKGAYLSLLYLRHLRIRELQRTCLGFLNYFRSIQRTLTIDTCCLTGNGTSLASIAGEEAPWVSAAQGGSGIPGGLGSHHYVHHTPADFKVQSSQFMEFSEMENHDDFYSIEDGIIHTQDQRGAFVMYDIALQDLKDIEEQLLLMTTHFIENDKSFMLGKKEMGTLDLSDWAHVNIDRTAMLLDLWTWESALLENKQQLLDSYYEAYQHVLDPEERFALVQVITDIMFRRPRFDIGSNYFLMAYRDECQCLNLHQQLVRNILNSQIDSQREFVQKIWRDGQKGSVYEFGRPLNISNEPLVSLNTSSPALKKVHLLEFHPSLGLAYLVAKGLDHIYQEFEHISQAKTSIHASSLEKHILQLALDTWMSTRDHKSTFGANIQKDLFEEAFVEDPQMVLDLCLSTLEAAEEEKKHGRGKQHFVLDIFSKILELVTTRHRIIEASFETAVLSRTYKMFAEEMGFNEFHLHLRPVHFEFASHKRPVEQHPPMFITSLLEDDSSVDRYTPSTQLLAIHEIDDNQIGKFSFWTKDGILQLLNKSGVENLQVTLACQVSQKHFLIAAVQLAAFCQRTSYLLQNEDIKDGYVDTQKQTSLTEKNFPSWSLVESKKSLAPMPDSSGEPFQGQWNKKRLPEAFVSIQLEKLGPRDTMLNTFLQKKEALGTVMRNSEEVEKLKRELITEYCQKLHRRASIYSLRGQIIAYFNSINNLLDEFPIFRKTYFVTGHAQGTKSVSKEALQPDPRTFQERPHSLLTEDGRLFLNLWYIPHSSEVLVMFKMLPEKDAFRALSQTLEIVAAMHDIISYIFSFARLGNSYITQTLTADWGGTEGIGAELRDIQKLIDGLHNPQDPKEVAKLLLLRREVLFLQFDAAVRHLIRYTFLSSGNVSAFRTTTDNMYHGLPALSNSVARCAFSSQLPIPQPLDPRGHRTFMLYPWRTFLADGGLFPLTINKLHTIGYFMRMCLCDMTDQERTVAHGELVGVHLLMEDILQDNYNFISFTVEGDVESRQIVPEGLGDKQQESSRKSSKQQLFVPHDPISAYKMLRAFLILWKQLELCKDKWGKLKLQVEEIDTVPLYRQFCEQYRDEIFYPTMKNIARQMGKEKEYEGLTLRTQTVLPPEGASEVEIRIRQLQKLLENFESHMIREVQKKIGKEITMVISERAREERGLPTELWKQPVMKENFSPVRPQIVEHFVQKLMSEQQDSNSQVTFNKDHLEACLTSLACDIMAREQSNFESYSMFYENLLQQKHQLLYQKEQELLELHGDQKEVETNYSKTAELSHDLIIEITALRARILYLEEQTLTIKETIKKEVQGEYEGLVRTLFAACVNLKCKLDEYHINMNRQVKTLISEVRKEGIDDMILLKKKYGSRKDDNDLRNTLAMQDKLQDLRDENSTLRSLVCKLKALNHWKIIAKEGRLRGKLRKSEKGAIQNKKDWLKLKMTVEKEVSLLRQELTVARTALTRTQAENSRVKQQLAKQKQLLNESEHRYSQETRSKHQLENIKSASVDKLLEDIEQKEYRLRSLAEEAEKSSKISQMQQNKTKKEVKQIKSQLMQERNLKLDAFQRVDELQTQVYDFEVSSSLHTSPTGTRKPSASLLSRSVRSISTVASNASPVCLHYDPGASVDYLHRCLLDDTKPSKPAERRIQRPKTAPIRCINRGTEQSSSTSQTVLMHLHELRLNAK
ncbi:Hypothetical predicted protein [Pelobates cultripes]|uniref:DUF4549 domain-containing protein n=1 Tax=Pelobates cultripes TaxID=61616 RepID=A0AAD1RFF3_PELCU|nr:Hypothetical predicted protein [Pelobates cultripes]